MMDLSVKSNPSDKALEFTAHDQPVSSCRFLDHDRLIVTASYDKTIAFWEASSGEKLHTLCGHSHRVVSLSMDESSHTMLSGSWDKSIVFWDTSSLDKVWTGHHESMVTTCHTAPEHHLAVAGCDDGSYCYWDTRTGCTAANINAHTNTITCCRFSSNGSNLCSTSMDNTSLMWDIRTHKQLLKLTGHVNVVSGCAFSHNSHYLATCSWDKTVRVYDVACGGYRAKGPVVLTNHEGCASACDFSNDGTMLVSCGYDHDINIWNTNTFQLKNTFRGHEGWIEDVHFGESSDWIVSCGRDGTVRVWLTDVDMHHYNKEDKPKLIHVGLELVKCSKCGRKFSPVVTEPEHRTENVRQATARSEKQTKDNSKEMPDNTDHELNRTLPQTDRGTQGVEVSAEEKTLDKMSTSGDNREDSVCLCVFCRLEDPSRTLEQRSGQYLTDDRY